MIKADPLTTAGEQAIAGQEYRSEGIKYQFLYVPASTEEGEILIKSFDGDEETNPKAIAAATSAVYRKAVVATKDQGATAGFQWCVVEGNCEALVDGTTDVAKDDYLEVLNGADGLVKDGTTRTTKSIAIAQEAQAADEDTLTSIYLLGDRVIVEAS